MRVLLLDEDEVSLFLMERSLAPEFEVFGHKSLNDARIWSMGNSFDVLIVDYSLYNERLPIDAIKELKEITDQKFRSIICASYMDSHREVVLYNSGYEKVFMKPFSKARLTEYLNNLA